MASKKLKAVGYVRGSNAPGQRAEIDHECAARGWDLLAVLEDGSDETQFRSPYQWDSLRMAIGMCNAEIADALIVADLGAPARNARQIMQLVATARARGWALVVLPSFDMTTTAGRGCAEFLNRLLEFEVTEAARRAQGRSGGRPSTLPAQVVERIKNEAAAGVALNRIARGLNDDQIPTGQGGRQWYASSVRAVLKRA